MPDDSIEQKRQQIIESYEREQKVFEKAYEDGAKLLKKSLEEKNLAGIDQARKNMNEASEILGDLVRGKNQALDELEKMAKPVTAEKQEQPDHSEEEDYYYGLGM